MLVQGAFKALSFSKLNKRGASAPSVEKKAGGDADKPARSSSMAARLARRAGSLSKTQSPRSDTAADAAACSPTEKVSSPGGMAAEETSSPNDAAEAGAMAPEALPPPALVVPPIAAPPLPAEAAPADAVYEPNYASATEPGVPLAPGWEPVTADDGRVYFWHEPTDKVSWDRPVVGSEVAIEAAAAEPIHSAPAKPEPSPADGAPAAPTDAAAPAADVAAFEPASDPAADPAKAPAPGAGSLLANVRAFEKKAAPALSAKPSQVELARRSLERKQAAQFKVVTNAAHSQHAQAIKGLERGAGSRGGSQHELAQRALERRLAPDATAGWDVAAAPKACTSSGAQEARAAILAKEKVGHDGTGVKGSQREEAMRKLSAVGVVKASEAFGTRSKAGTQHADAMSAFKQMGGVSAETAMAKRSDLKGRATSAASPDNDPGSQRASAMAALKAQLSAEHAAN